MAALLFSCNGASHPGEDEAALRAMPNYAGVCIPGREGCPCNTPGTAVSCGTLTARYGDYVTCQMGESVCAGGTWGACAGDRQVVTKNLAPLSGGSGIHILTTPPTPCGGMDVCDPGCFWTVSTETDVNAPGLGPAPGNAAAVTLVSTECTGLQCQIPSNCDAGSPTQLTGVVTDPAGQNPISNAVVYIPLDPSGALTPFSPGASCDSCAGTGTVEAVVLTTTGPDGSFTLSNVPSTDMVPHAAIPLVVQTGKWRREKILTAVPECVTTQVAPELSRLPQSHTDGDNDGQADLPKFAIATANEDALECLLLRIGVDVGEFLPGGQMLPDGGLPTNRVDLYQGNGPAYMGMTTPPETQLEADASTLMPYDAVLLPCQGGNSNLAADDRLGYASNVAAYANAGGRIFTTHRSISWLAMTGGTGNASAINPANNEPNPFYGTVNWNISHGSTFTMQASIDTTVAGVTDDAGAPVPDPEGEAFAAWMADVGAGSPLVPIEQAAVDVTSVNPPTEEWMRSTDAPNGDNGPLSFSFDTPVAGTAGADGGVVTADSGAGSCGRVFFNDFHVAASDRVSTSCVTDNDCGYSATGANATCTSAQPGACVPVYCDANTPCGAGFTCGPLGQSTCYPVQHCNDDSDCRSGACLNSTCILSPEPCTTQADCGPVEMCGLNNDVCGHDCQVDGDCAGGESCVDNRCAGCFTGPDCASQQCQGVGTLVCSQTSTDFPLECKQGHDLTPQEKALEFMLFDLTSCVAPAAFNVQPVKYEPATFTETFTGSQCQIGETVTWRELDWNATIPGDSSITFSVQTGNPAPDGGPPIWNPSMPALLAKATTSTLSVVTPDDAGPDADTDATVTVSPYWDVALIDTGENADGGPNSVLNSQSELLLTVTLTPTSDMLQAPTLNQWRITSVCMPSE
ncbi:MAG TPA: hypothetical protein VK841_21225 [Polyangiaceae bacterium]|nr:hypothetical protein [Polyangiaceae bacterium]